MSCVLLACDGSGGLTSLLSGCVDGSESAISGHTDPGTGFVPIEVSDEVADRDLHGTLIWYDGWPDLQSNPDSGRSDITLRLTPLTDEYLLVREATSESPLSSCEDAVVRTTMLLQVDTDDGTLELEQEISVTLNALGATFEPILLINAFRGSFTARANDPKTRWLAMLEGDIGVDGDWIARLVLYGGSLPGDAGDVKRIVLAVGYFNAP